MPNLSTSILDGILNHIFRGESFPVIEGPFEISLHTGDPGTNRANEVSTGVWTNYSRQTLERDTTDWSSAEAHSSGRKIENAVAVDFGTATVVSTAPVVTHVSVYDSASPTQVHIGNYELPDPQTINNGNPVSIPIGGLRQALTEAA